jgi:Zn2+/Cd2+-exporting ATPase
MYRTGQLGKGWPMTDTVQTRYRVTGMDCGSCAAKVDAAVRRLPGVADVSVSATAGIMMVHHAPEDTLLPALKANLKGLGYDVSPADGKAAQAPDSKSHDHDHAHSHDEPTDLHSHLHEHGAEEGPWWRSPARVC